MRRKKFAAVVLSIAILFGLIPDTSVSASQADDLINVAMGELHNTDGTKYGVSGAWCDAFIRWCADQANIPTSVLPRLYGTEAYRSQSNYHTRGTYSPKRGDIVLLDWDFDNISDHVEIVTGVHSDGVYTIGGNTSLSSNSSVYGVETKTRYNYKSWGQILGYLEVNYSGSGNDTEPLTTPVITSSKSTYSYGSTVTLSWNAVSGASGYSLYIWGVNRGGTVGNLSGIGDNGVVTSGGTSWSGVLPPDSYVVYVSAFNDNEWKTSSGIKFTVSEENVTTPTTAPTLAPTAEPTATATFEPTVAPTAAPTTEPTTEPVSKSTSVPTAVPTAISTALPTATPTTVPTIAPTTFPTVKPTAVPTIAPTTSPTVKPTARATSKPTTVPTPEPSYDFYYETGDITLIDPHGNKLDAAPINESFIIEAEFMKTNERESRDYFIAAVYDENGTLLSLDFFRGVFPVGQTYSVGFNIQPQSVPVGKIKTFVWSDLSSLTPLASVKEFE